MKKYTVEIEATILISVDVTAKNKSEAKEVASELEIVEYSAKQGHSTAICVKGEATLYIDRENLYDKIIGVTEI